MKNLHQRIRDQNEQKMRQAEKHTKKRRVARDSDNFERFTAVSRGRLKRLDFQFEFQFSYCKVFTTSFCCAAVSLQPFSLDCFIWHRSCSSLNKRSFERSAESPPKIEWVKPRINPTRARWSINFCEFTYHITLEMKLCTHILYSGEAQRVLQREESRNFAQSQQKQRKKHNQ